MTIDLAELEALTPANDRDARIVDELIAAVQVARAFNPDFEIHVSARLQQIIDRASA